MAGVIDSLKSVGAGFIAVELSELLFHKGAPMVPFLAEKRLLTRALIAGGATLAMSKSAGVTRDAMLCVAASNTSGAAHTIEKYHDFLGISDHAIDDVASEAVRSIEASINDEITKMKEGLNSPVSNPVSSPLSRNSEEVEYEMVFS